MKKTYIAISVAMLIAAMLTVYAVAADPIQVIKNADTQLRDGVSTLVGLAGILAGGVVFWASRKMVRALGTIAGGALISYLISNPSIIGGLMEGVAAWFK